MAAISITMMLILCYCLMMITNWSASAMSECFQSRYLPYIDAHYTNDHIVPVMDGQSVTILCTVYCPSSNENLNVCSENIHQDWMIIDPSEDEIYKINTDRNNFIRSFEIDDSMIEFSNSSFDFEQCSLNETGEFQYSLTIHNFTSSLEGLMVICGLRRFGPIRAEYHLVGKYARLWPVNMTQCTVPCEPTAVASPTESTTSSTTNTTQSSTSISVIKPGSASSWPNEASFPVIALLSAVCIFLAVVIAVLIKYTIKLRKQLANKKKKYTAQARHTSHTYMNSNNHHYDAFPKHPWQTAALIDSSNDPDLWPRF